MFGLRGPTDCFPLGYAESSAGYGATFRNLAEEVFLDDTWTQPLEWETLMEQTELSFSGRAYQRFL